MVRSAPVRHDGVPHICPRINGIHSPLLGLRTKVSLPVDFMYPNPNQPQADSHHNYVHERQQAFLKAYDLASTALNFNQKRRNAIYNRKVHGLFYDEGQKVLLHKPVVPPGKSPKFFSSWRGQYIVLQRINDVTFKIQEFKTKKELVCRSLRSSQTIL